MHQRAWLGQFRRLLVRHEHPLTVYRAFSILPAFYEMSSLYSIK